LLSRQLTYPKRKVIVKFKEFSWNGFFIEIPEEMRFTSFGGNVKSGNFMLESEGCILEARWEPSPTKKAKPLAEVAESLIEQIKKKLKKQDVTVLAKDETHVSIHDALYVVLKSRLDERIYIWYCQESKRVMILRFLFKTFDKSSKEVMKHVLDSLVCHGGESNIWSLMNVRFETPPAFLLTGTKISVGRAYFMLTDRKLSAFTEKSTKILVEYFSMANVLYKEACENLDKWLEQYYMKDLRKKFGGRKVKFEAATHVHIRRHNAALRQATTKSGLLSRKTTLYSNATWYCSGMNRIYSVTIGSTKIRPALLERKIDKKDHTNLLKNLLSSFQCHSTRTAT
jgi:hypothetical protein